MEPTLSRLLLDAKLSIERPREGARRVLNLGLGAGAAWMFVALMAVLSALLAEVVLTLLPMEAASTAPVPPELADIERLMNDLTSNPLSFAALQFVVMAIAALLAQGVGRLAGGTGSLTGAATLMGWLQAILLLVQILQILLLVVLPPLAPVLGLLAIGLIGWILANFVAELHGFRSAAQVFLGIVATLVALAFAMAVVMVFMVGIGA